MRVLLALLPAIFLWQSHAVARPNFIIIYVDDLGWADTSVGMMDCDPESRSDFNRTPRLERLAGRGMKFSCA